MRDCCSARLVGLVVWLLAAVSAAYAAPPICPHITAWRSDIETWATGAPWVKVLSAVDCERAKNMGAQVYYRPYDIPGHDDGGTGDATGMANNVLARLGTIPTNKWPDAIGYRNEFGGNDTTTTQQFIIYYDVLRARGYQGWIVFGSYSTGVPESYRWSQTDVVNAVNKADAIETHEYFDMTEAYCHTWLCCRHVRFISENPYLLGKPWFIGEAGSDRIDPGSGCHEDPCSRRGWRYTNECGQKLSESTYINELTTYRNACASQVVAVFLFQQGDNNWYDFDVMGTSVATWMQTTWNVGTGTIAGNVKNTSGQNLSDATVTTSPGGYSDTTDGDGNYSIPNVPAGTYSVTATKSGYQSETQEGKTVTAGATTVVNFTLSEVVGHELLSNGSFENGCTGWSHSESPSNIYWGCGNKEYPGTTVGDGGHCWNAFLSCGGYFCDQAFTGEQHQENVAVSAGASYTASAQVYYEPVLHAGDPSDQKERIVLSFNDGGGTTHTSDWHTHTTSNGWDAITLSGSVPAGATTVTFKVELSHTDGHWSGTGAVDECSLLSEPVSTIAEAKGYPDGTVVCVADKIVSAATGSAFWIQEPDRTCGIKVVDSNPPAEGALVTLVGVLATSDGERTLTAVEQDP